MSSAAEYASVWRAADERVRFVDRLLVVFPYVGGCVLPLLLLAPWLGGRRWLLMLAALALVWAAAAHFYLRVVPRPDSLAIYYAQSAVFAVAGMVLAALAILDVEQRRDTDAVLLTLWVFGTLLFACFLNWTLNVRSVLPLVPAASILAMRRLEACGWPSAARREYWLLVPLGAAAALSLIVAWADRAYAVADRSAAAEFASLARERHQRLWFFAQYGFHYYLQQAGFDPLTGDQYARAGGDLYAEPAAVGVPAISDPKMEFISELRFAAAPLGATMDRAAGAGFYASALGQLPYSLVPARDYSYRLFRIRAHADSRPGK